MPSRSARRRTKRRGSCLSLVVLLGVGLLLLLESYALWGRPQLSQYIGQQVSDNLVVPADLPVGLVDPALSDDVQERIAEAEATLPTAVAALPSGQLVVTQDQANTFFAANRAALDPIESLTVRFVPGQIEADMQVLGTQARLTSSIAAVDGRLQVRNPRLDGPLGYLISVEEVIGPIEQQLNDQLLAQGQRISEARIEQGQLVLLVEGG